jgi:hypothetical protein
MEELAASRGPLPHHEQAIDYFTAPDSRNLPGNRVGEQDFPPQNFKSKS